MANATRPYGVSITPRQARDRVQWLDLWQPEEFRLSLNGVLVGGNIETARFEIKADDEVFRGRTSDQAREQMKEITFGASVAAELRVTRMIHEEWAMEPALVYLLESVQLSR